MHLPIPAYIMASLVKSLLVKGFGIVNDHTDTYLILNVQSCGLQLEPCLDLMLLWSPRNIAKTLLLLAESPRHQIPQLKRLSTLQSSDIPASCRDCASFQAATCIFVNLRLADLNSVLARLYWKDGDRTGCTNPVRRLSNSDQRCRAAQACSVLEPQIGQGKLIVLPALVSTFSLATSIYISAELRVLSSPLPAIYNCSADIAGALSTARYS